MLRVVSLIGNGSLPCMQKRIQERLPITLYAFQAISSGFMSGGATNCVIGRATVNLELLFNISTPHSSRTATFNPRIAKTYIEMRHESGSILYDQRIVLQKKSGPSDVGKIILCKLHSRWAQMTWWAGAPYHTSSPSRPRKSKREKRTKVRRRRCQKRKKKREKKGE